MPATRPGIGSSAWATSATRRCCSARARSWRSRRHRPGDGSSDERMGRLGAARGSTAGRWPNGPFVPTFGRPMAGELHGTRMDAAREQALVADARADAAAFGELYDFYLPRIYGFVARRVE